MMKLERHPKRYFADYSPEEIIDSRGRHQVRLVYRGDTVELCLTEKERRIRAVLRPLSVVAADLALVFSLTRNTALNREGALSALSLVMLFPAFFATTGAVAACIYPLRLTKTQYRASVLYMKAGSVIGAVYALLLAVWHALRIRAVLPETEQAGGFLTVAGYLCCALCLALLFIMEYRVDVRIHKASETGEDDTEEKGTESDV